MAKIALLVIYNHRFDKNIPIIEKIYATKFQHIFHIMPFYDGNKENVISVYESSRYFQGYISQAYTYLKNKGFTHYFIVADDMIVNPLVNEDNIFSIIGISEKDNFIPGFIEFQKQKSYWDRTTESYMYNPIKIGVEVQNILPSFDDAIKRFHLHNLSVGYIPMKNIFALKRNNPLYKNISFLFKEIIKKIMHPFRKYYLKYPLVGSYSDIALITADVMPKFAQYCGAFAATELFVEIALPTALVLSADNIVTEKDTLLKGKALWTKEDYKILDKYNNSLSLLQSNFPKDYLYLHPIKLSKWE